ncbi:MAG: peptidase C15 [Cyanobacteriota bacterium]|nr:peptidase C15 [Cyanobacteriota bacterium]
MSRTILLTSFQTWLPHQVSNSSDDLLEEVQKYQLPQRSLIFLRHLPVETDRASQRVLSALKLLQPDAIACCGMAESREKLTVESNARRGDRQLKTSFNLKKLVIGLKVTEISHDAGQFVCEGLYYEILNALQRDRSSSRCLFIHVPPLSPDNQSGILADFLALLSKI